MKRSKNELHGIFVDFKKAFDSVNQAKLWQKLYEIGISGKIVRIIKNLYAKASTRISQNNEISKPVEINKGVLQETF